MRIVKREEFLALPGPFIFAKCDQYGNADEPMVRYDSYHNDFTYQDLLLEPDYWGSSDRWEHIQKMLDDPTYSLPVVDDNTARDGFFDDERFIVFDRKDFDVLVGFLLKLRRDMVSADGKRDDYTDEIGPLAVIMKHLIVMCVTTGITMEQIQEEMMRQKEGERR